MNTPAAPGDHRRPHLAGRRGRRPRRRRLATPTNLWQPRCERARPTTSPVSVGTGTPRPDLTGTATATHHARPG